MKNIIKFFILLSICLPAYAYAQHRYQAVLDAVERNNSTLKALQQRRDAERSSVRANSMMADPQVEFGYYWGAPEDIGRRWDLSVTQSFEFPTIYIYKNKIFDLQEQHADLHYETERARLFIQAQQICAEWIYYEAVQFVHSDRVKKAIDIADLYEKRYQAGDCSIIEYQRAQLYLAHQQALSADAGLKADHALHELWVITGIDGYQLDSDQYPDPQLSDTFDEWYYQIEQQNSQLKYLGNLLDIKQQETALQKAEWLPKMNAGYASENVVGETFRGFTVGMTLPLWSNRNKVRQSQLEADATAADINAYKVGLYNNMLCAYHRAKAMENNVRNLKRDLAEFDSTDLLQKALEAGEITLEQYLQEVNSYAEVQLTLLETQYQLEQLVLQLNSITF